ncbi:MAG TPA: hypothetical protein VFU22_22375 [Roseiflexaceae bacterium]|nr:hypothetical protein [Roseiflexaceae bacterium]
MYNPAIERCDELIERRLLQVLSWNSVLPYAELKTRAAAAEDDRAFRRVIDDLIARGLVRRKADRKGLWYFGYAVAQPADHRASLDEVPAPFRNLLSELMW